MTTAKKPSAAAALRRTDDERMRRFEDRLDEVADGVKAAASDGVGTKRAVNQILTEMKLLNGQVNDHHRTLYGHPDPNRHTNEPGLETTVKDHDKFVTRVRTLVGVLGATTVGNVVVMVKLILDATA